MKIGVVTVHDSANYGSYLQAYALQLALQDMGHEVEFIKTRSEQEVKNIFFDYQKLSMSYIGNYGKNRKKYQMFARDRQRFTERNLADVSKETYDCVIIGSDELWNICTPHFRNDYFYGAQIPAEKKLVYAISAGKATLEDYAAYPNLQEYIKKLPTILVRDDATQRLVQEITGRVCPKVCDPTFLVDVSRLQTDYQNPIKGEYLLVYAYGLGPKLIEYIKQYAHDNHLKLAAACMKQNWCDYNIMCSPLEFSKLIQGAYGVVTATFHGSIFSFLNKSRFVSSAGLNKVREVLQLVGLEDAIISKDCSYDEFKRKLDTNRDYAAVDAKIKSYREQSLQILRTELQ